jgi:SAM-dependent methyltransferase
MDFDNVYEDARRAEAYAKLEFPGTYYLAYRDLPEIIAQHVMGNRALDFGCGAGRSSRYLRKLGFEVVGVDISEAMLTKARAGDPNGEYLLVSDGDLSRFTADNYDLALSAFTFDNIPTFEKKLNNFREIRRLLKPGGIMINLVSSPEIYTHEWASFTTADFPENRHARSGDKVKIIMKDVDDRRPVEDIIFMDDAYRELYKLSGLEPALTHKPLARESEPYEWINELHIAPWTIYVLKKS